MKKSQKIAPPPAFAAAAHVKTKAVRQAFVETANAQPESFWKELARAIPFTKPFDKVLEWNCPQARWFVNGKLNVSAACLDKHVKAGQGNRVALMWEGEPIDGAVETRRITYAELLDQVSRLANALKKLDVRAGDRVAIYMPLVPETVAAMLACARIGAVHTVIFGGFSSQAISDRLIDSGAKVILTATGTYRKGQWLDLKKVVDEALDKGGHDVEHVVVFSREASRSAPLMPGRDLAWSKLVEAESAECAPAELDSEHPLFILYTSGTTGKPKGLFHTQAGYLLWAHWTTRWLFDLKPDDIYWCTADCGWITGHTYVTYGPLSNGATVFLYEGAPNFPDVSRFWSMIERHKISILYTAPTAIRNFMRFGDEPVKKHDLKSLRLLGSVGEPINPEAWLWYHDVVGGGRCPVVDTWWQTETGGAMIAPFPGTMSLKPGSAMRALPGIEAEIVNAETAEPVKKGEKGVLVIRKPWPSMARGIWGDPVRFEQTYWKTKPAFEGTYVTADLAEADDDGDIWIEGRMDDVLNVSGHRIGSAEVESALVGHPLIAEAAAVGIPDAVKGQAIAVFITLTEAAQAELGSGRLGIDGLKMEARDYVAKEIGALARPDVVRTAKALPKTRSGKIMRRLLRELASTGKITGDTTTLEDFSAEASLGSED